MARKNGVCAEGKEERAQRKKRNKEDRGEIYREGRRRSRREDK